MGAFFAVEWLVPDLVLCSPSARTRETADLAFSAAASVGAVPKIQFDDVLYLASAKTLLTCIQRVPSTCRHLMIIGHNPGLQLLAIDLIGSGDQKQRTAIEHKLPTAALVEIEFEAASWADVRSGGGELVRFVTPRMLQDRD